MLNQTQILNSLHKALPELQQKYPIAKLALFGSYSRNEQHPESDIDIMVEFSKPVGIEFIDLSFELEKIFGRKVDLVSQKAIKPKYFELLKNDLRYA
jgi:predicted nucleotidyltransferase